MWKYDWGIHVELLPYFNWVGVHQVFALVLFLATLPLQGGGSLGMRSAGV
jgi:hypothetical protein